MRYLVVDDCVVVERDTEQDDLLLKRLEKSVQQASCKHEHLEVMDTSGSDCDTVLVRFRCRACHRWSSDELTNGEFDRLYGGESA